MGLAGIGTMTAEPEETVRLQLEEPMPVDMTVPGYDPSTLPAEPENGVVVDPALFPGEDRDIGSLMDRPSTQLDIAYERNRDMGHSAATVVAVARTAGELTYSGLPREPLLWIGLTGALGALTLGAGLLWARAAPSASCKTPAERRTTTTVPSPSTGEGTVVVTSPGGDG